MRSVNVILVGYDVAWTARAIKHCRRAFDALQVKRRILVANGAPPPENAADGWTVLRGSNKLGEFSGWQEALHVSGAEKGQATTVFVNDTVGAYRHLPLFTRIAMRHEIRALTGLRWIGFSEVDTPPPGQLKIDGLEVPRWASSYCFALSAESAALLDWRLYEPERVAACVAGGSDEESFFTNLVSPALQRHLRWWLFDGGWHRSQRLGVANAERMAFKARCICAELLLSARCLALGITLRDPLEVHPWASTMNRRAAWVRNRLTRN